MANLKNISFGKKEALLLGQIVGEAFYDGLLPSVYAIGEYTKQRFEFYKIHITIKSAVKLEKWSLNKTSRADEYNLPPDLLISISGLAIGKGIDCHLIDSLFQASPLDTLAGHDVSSYRFYWLGYGKQEPRLLNLDTYDHLEKKGNLWTLQHTAKGTQREKRYSGENLMSTVGNLFLQLKDERGKDMVSLIGKEGLDGENFDFISGIVSGFMNDTHFPFASICLIVRSENFVVVEGESDETFKERIAKVNAYIGGFFHSKNLGKDLIKGSGIAKVVEELELVKGLYGYWRILFLNKNQDKIVEGGLLWDFTSFSLWGERHRYSSNSFLFNNGDLTIDIISKGGKSARIRTNLGKRDVATIQVIVFSMLTESIAGEIQTATFIAQKCNAGEQKGILHDDIETILAQYDLSSYRQYLFRNEVPISL